MDLVEEEVQYEGRLTSLQDDKGEDEPENGPDHDHRLQSSSVFDNQDADQFLGENNGSKANEVTDPGPLCTEVEDKYYSSEDEEYFVNVPDGVKKLPPDKGSKFKNGLCQSDKDEDVLCSEPSPLESPEDSSDIDLEKCSALDLSELKTEQCESNCDWEQLTDIGSFPSLQEGNENSEQEYGSDYHISLLHGSENPEERSFHDVHSLQRDSGWCEDERSSLNPTVHKICPSSPISHTNETESHFSVSATCVHSSNLIPLPFEWENENLDMQSLEENSTKQDSNNAEYQTFLSQTTECNVFLNTGDHDFHTSDSDQNKSGLSFEISRDRISSTSHEEERLKTIPDDVIDSGFLRSNRDISADHSFYVFNYSVALSSSSIPLSLLSEREEHLIIDLGKSQKEEKVTYNFNERKNTSDKFSNSQHDFSFNGENNTSDNFSSSKHDFEERKDRSFSLPVTDERKSSEDRNTSENHHPTENCSISTNSTGNTNQLLQKTCNTVSKSSFSYSTIHHIIFYIVHITSSQKAIITFHDLEVIHDSSRRTLSTLRSIACTFQRGSWLLYHLERLGFFTFHQIAPMVVIVEPALDGLGRYFQQMEQGPRVTVLQSMQYEWMRVRSFWSFPRNAGVSYLHLARLGFFYTGRVSETRCYSCGQVYKEWREGDDPLEIHRRISPQCPHLNGGDPRNMPIYQDVVNQWPAIPWEPMLDDLEERERPQAGGEPDEQAQAGASAMNTEQTTNLDTRSQHPSQKTNIAVRSTPDRISLGEDASVSSIGEYRESRNSEIGRVDLSQVVPRPAVLDSTPHSEVAAAEQNPDQSSSGEGPDRVPPDRPQQNPQPRPDPNPQEQEPRGQDNIPQGQEWGRIIFPPNPLPNPAENPAERPAEEPVPRDVPRAAEEEVPRGVPRADPQALYMPRYPNFVVQAQRADTFLQGWPAYLNQTPYEMSSAGFFYTGNGDYCRCFYCGGGLRNWEPGDDPWVEHARWFPRCLFVRQNKGERFVRLVQQRQDNDRQNAPPRREPVLQPPSTNQPRQPPVERNQHQGQAAPPPSNQPGQERDDQASSTTTTGQRSQQGATSGQDSEDTESPVDEMSLSAVESLKVNGYSSSRIQTALQIWKKQQKKPYKMSDVTSTKLVQIIFDLEDKGSERLSETNQLASSLSQGNVLNGETGRSDGAIASASNDPEMIEKLSLYNEVEERKKQLMCSVCGENEVTIAFLPCGHLVCCSQCAPAMIKCPTCGELIKGNVKVYLM